jgi:hypothetical protein
MAGFGRRLRRFATRAAFIAATAFAFAASADAQWASPFGAASPGEIVQRLRAEGYVLIGPLRRSNTVYLADVVGGPAGRERLVLDAWSGEILQRFVARRGFRSPGGYVPEGGEFNEPPPLGPPPARDFREGNYGYEPGAPSSGVEAPPKVKWRSRPAATARRGGEPKPTAPEPQTAGNRGVAPTAAAPTGVAAPATGAPGAPVARNAAEPAKADSSPSNAAVAPKPDVGPSSAAEQAKEAAPSAGAARANPGPASAERPGEKKVNDVPVNPLD